MPLTIPENVYQLCRSPESVTSQAAAAPTFSPGGAIKKLINHHFRHPHEPFSPSQFHAQRSHEPLPPDSLQRAFECGRWGPTRPSDLFLTAFHDSLVPLIKDPLIGCISPSLIGRSGVIPLSIVAPLLDICRHMANLIARAQKEVLLATNYWMSSNASRIITDGLRELSKRAGERGDRAVVKLIYDRGNVKQIFDHHQSVGREEYTGKNVELPIPEDIPNIDMEIINYHQPPLGTFHSKFMVVDRKFAVIQSNNIQDNDNLEMMAQVEGPIVDSFYDTFLISWHNAMSPPLPCLKHPADEGGLPTFEEPSFRGLRNDNDSPDQLEPTSVHVPIDSSEGTNESRRLSESLPGEPRFDADIATEVERMRSVMTPQAGETHMDTINRKLNNAKKDTRKATAPDDPNNPMTPYVPHRIHHPVPIAMVNRRPYGPPNHSYVQTPQNEAWLSLVRNAKDSVFIQTPDLNAAPLLPELIRACRRGIRVKYYVCLGYNDAGELLPFQGGNNEMVASKLYDELGADGMGAEGARKNLHVHYYVGKDQTAPIHNSFKSRSCHIKLMIVDGHIGILGSGNQDTQSWYHSQEVNIMIDSQEICRSWENAIRRNQNTEIYGKASQEDGVWRDESGKEADGAIGKNPPPFAWARGFLSAVQRVRGVGGF